MKNSKRNVGLDVLRALAIVGVVLCHGLHLYVRGRDVLESFGSGVELFFVLSGFLIGRIYFRSTEKNQFTFFSFWRSRWWRTLPPYFATLLLYVAMRHLWPFPSLRWYYLLFLQNYMGITKAKPFSDGFGPSWSLCVEEHFYLALPIVGFAVDRFIGRSAFRYLLPVAFIVPTVLRFALLASGHLPAQWYWFTQLHCDGLIAGVWLAYNFVDRPQTWASLKKPAQWLLWIAPAMLLAVPFMNTNPGPTAMLLNTFYALGFAAWVRWLYDLSWMPATAASRLTRSLATGIALCSYSIYLTHTLFDPWLRNGVFGAWHRGAAKSMIVLSLTLLLGVIFYFLIELPTIVSRDRYLKRVTVKSTHPRDPQPVDDRAMPIAVEPLILSGGTDHKAA